VKTQEEVQANWLIDIIIGMSDGLTMPFVLAAGVSSVAPSTNTVLITGLAGTGLGAFIMALGGYFTNKKEAQNKSNMPEIYRNLDLSEDIQQQALEDVEKENKDWAEYTMQHEPVVRNAAGSALVIALSYMAGGLITLSPYFFVDTPIEALQYSAIITLISLFVFGYFKSRFTGQHPWLGALQLTLIAAIAASGAFGVARLFV
jgi:VIT1/CCC1 family predicted Fe2+/Mn2+ transporter